MLFEKIIKLEQNFILEENSFDFFIFEKPEEFKTQLEVHFSSNLVKLIYNILSDKLYHQTYVVSSPNQLSLTQNTELFLHLKTFSSKSNSQNLHFSYIQRDAVMTQGFLLQHINNNQIAIIIPKDSKALFNILIHSSTNKSTSISLEKELLENFYLPVIDCSIENFVPQRTTEGISIGFTKDDVSFLRRKSFYLIPLAEDCLLEVDGIIYSHSHYFDELFTLSQIKLFEELAELYISYLKNNFSFSEEQFSYFLKKDVLVLCFEPSYSTNSEVSLCDIIDTIQRNLRFDEKSLEIHEESECITLIFNRLFSNSSFEYIHCFIDLNEEKVITDIHFLFSRFNERDIVHFFDQFINKKLNSEALSYAK